MDRCDACIGECRRETHGLLDAGRVQRDVGLPLQAPDAIPVGLAVTNDDEFDHAASLRDGSCWRLATSIKFSSRSWK